MTPSRGPDWRDEAASSLLAGYLSTRSVAGPALVLGDRRPEVPEALALAGVAVTRWGRRVGEGEAVSSWPPPAGPGGPFATVALRLPLAKDELEMTLHAALSVLRPGGELFVHGARDEGIGSVAPRVEALVGTVAVVATGGRCRVLAGRRPATIDGLRATLSDWRETFPLPLQEISRPWVSYPGVFAHGRLDEGTLLIAETLPAHGPAARVLDFACGSGVLGALLAARNPRVTVDFLDVDAVALAAVGENVPGGREVLSDGLSALGGERYDLIVSNPPIHRGKAQTLDVLAGLIRGAPSHLTKGGSLRLVTQRRLPVQRMLEERFDAVETIADDGRLFRVWSATAQAPR